MEEKKVGEERFSLIKKILSIVILFGIVVLFITEFAKDDPNLLRTFIITGVAILFWVFIYFGVDFIKKFKMFQDEKESKEKLPEVFSQKEIKELILEKIESVEYQNHIKRWGQIVPHTVGKNLIYEFELDLLHEDKKLGTSVYFVVNAHYPKERFSVISVSKQRKFLKTIINNMSTNPEDNPETEVSEESLDAFGKPIRKTTKVTPNKKSEKKEEKKKEDLA